jgi:hypothetical protein
LILLVNNALLFYFQTLDELTEKAVPSTIRLNKELNLEDAVGQRHFDHFLCVNDSNDVEICNVDFPTFSLVNQQIEAVFVFCLVDDLKV